MRWRRRRRQNEPVKMNNGAARLMELAVCLTAIVQRTHCKSRASVCFFLTP